LVEINDAIRAVLPFPRTGHSRPDLTSRPIRFVSVRDFLIAYAPEESRLLVLGVLHAGVILASSRHTFAQEDKQRTREHAMDEPFAKSNMLAIRHAIPAVS
jgi:hypothetical protein